MSEETPSPGPASNPAPGANQPATVAAAATAPAPEPKSHTRRKAAAAPQPELPEGSKYLGPWQRLLASLADSLLIMAVIVPLLWALYGPGYFSLRQSWEPLMEQFAFISESMGAVLDIEANYDLPEPPPPPPSPTLPELLIKIGLPAAAFLIFWRYRSATPGKMLFKARIVDATTLGPASNSQLLLRYVGYYLGVCSCLLGFLWICFDRRRQGIHDKMANTVVITP